MFYTTDCLEAYLTKIKTHNWIEWTAASVFISQTKGNGINNNFNDRLQMQNDTENDFLAATFFEYSKFVFPVWSCLKNKTYFHIYIWYFI